MPALAVRVASGGKSGCYADFDVKGVSSASGRKVECTDCDPTCDFKNVGQADRECDFMVRYCLNDTAAAPKCTVHTIKSVKAKPPLLTPGSLTFPNSSTNCGAFADVPVKVKVKKHGKKLLDGKQKLMLTARATGKGPKTGTDSIVLVCHPRPVSQACPTTTTTTLPPPVPGCGNGQLDPGEQCDLTAANSPPCPQGLTCCNCQCSGPCTNPSYSQFSFLTTPVTTTCGGGGLTKHCTVFSVADTYGKPCTVDTDCNGRCQSGTCGLHGGICTVDSDCVGTCSGGPAPTSPFSGEIDDAAGNKITDLGATCLYIGGGGNTATPPSKNPDGSLLYLDARCDAANRTNLCASSTVTDPKTCTKGAGPGKHCINQNTQGACNTDADCGGNSGSCGEDANCYFGPPLPIVGSASTCVVNVVQRDAFGSVDPAAGSLDMTIPLSSRVYLVPGTAPCPLCPPTGVPCTMGKCGVDGVGKTCATAADCNNTCDSGLKEGLACIGVGSQQTSVDCPPMLGSFLAPLPVTLSHLTTGTSSQTGTNRCASNQYTCVGGTNASSACTNGSKCPGGTCGVNEGQACTSDSQCPGGACQPSTFCGDQGNNTGFGGAFGESLANKITEVGVPAGSLLDLATHPLTIGAVFCIPPTGGFIDAVVDLPGPGATTLVGTAKLQ